MVEPVIVSVKEGKLQGKLCNDYRGGKYYSFQGIPYAKPPVGELRFKAPQPPESWNGIRDATIEGNISYSQHMLSGRITGSEDCLFLNVYTSQLPNTKADLLPVMVWIHGGGFLFGSGDSDVYGPDFLVAENVVVVTINYRLGIPGFLNFKDPTLEIPGNAGLKDQVMALKWIQQNIERFGGDPSNVTAIGWSAGAISVHYLILSPLCAGLFHRAIIQSGSVLGCRARAQCSAPLLAKTLNLPDADERTILKILQGMTVEQIFELQQKNPDRFMASELKKIGPVIENTSNEMTFISQEPLNIISSGKYNHVPLLIGFTSREGMCVSAKNNDKGIITDFENEVPYILNFAKGSEKSKEVAQKLKCFFYGNETPSSQNKDCCYLLQTDNYFLRPVYNTVKQHINTATKPIYFYRVSIESKLNTFKTLFGIKFPGVCHGDEVGYLFKSKLTPEIRPQSIEEIGIKRFTKLWTTFARNGNPNPITPDSLINISWEPVQKEKISYLDIGQNLTMGVNPEMERMNFWDEIYAMC